MQEGEPALEMEIDVEVGGQAPPTRVADQESFFVHDAKRKASPILDKISDIGIAREKRQRLGHDGFRYRCPAPGEKAVRSIPSQRARPLSRDDGIFQAVVDRGVCPRARARI